MLNIFSVKHDLDGIFTVKTRKESNEFPFWGLNSCVDFDLRDLKKWKI